MLNKSLLKKNPTNAEVLGFAMDIKDKITADKYFEELVQDQMKRWGHDRQKAERNVKSNLGYYSGYYGKKTMNRVQKLFDCEHPIFGKTK